MQPLDPAAVLAHQPKRPVSQRAVPIDRRHGGWLRGRHAAGQPGATGLAPDSRLILGTRRWVTGSLGHLAVEVTSSHRMAAMGCNQSLIFWAEDASDEAGDEVHTRPMGWKDASAGVCADCPSLPVFNEDI